MNQHEYQSQLQSIHTSIKEIQAQNVRLSKTIEQPEELSQDIREQLNQTEEDLDLVNESITDLPNPRHKSEDKELQRLRAQLSRLEEDLKHARAHFRKAQITARRANQSAVRREREAAIVSLTSAPTTPSSGTDKPGTPDLFAGRKTRPKRDPNATQDDLVVSVSSDVTASLRRTHDLLSTELSRSRFAQETLDQSTAALADLGEKYSGLDDILTNSRNLLGTLLRSQKSDTWYLETCFYILFATLCWLAFRRLLYGPLYLLPAFLWRIASFLLYWVVLKPIVVFATITGVLTTEPIGARKSLAYSSSISASRTPLITHRSATNRASAYPHMLDKAPQAVPAGAGGGGAKIGKDGGYLQHVGRMTEESEKAAKGQQQERGDNAVRRGDGTLLQERGDIPTNPKKKALEELEPQDEPQERPRDEL